MASHAITEGAGESRSTQIVQIPIGLTAAALAVLTALSALTWVCWDTRAGAAILGPTGILAVFAFVLVAEMRWRAERMAGKTVRLYELLAEHSTDMIVSFDPHTQLRTYISPSCRRLYGYEPEEAISMAATEVIHPDDFPAVEAALEGINGSGQGSVTYRARRKDGTYIWVEASLTASRNPASGAVEIVSVVRDVSERVRSEEKLRKAKAEAEAGSRAKSEFLSTVSHELRTPLNAVIGFSEIMQREILGPIGNEKYRSYLADIQSSGRLLLNVINDILDLSKAEAGKLELSETVFDMEGTIRSALKLLRPSIEKAGLCVEVCMPSGLPMLCADEHKTQQVFLNLLSNALKFTNPGGHIEVAAWVDVEGGIRVRVTDTGIGIEADRLASVFEPFTQIDSALSRKHNGSGLGLSVVKAIVERHNGSVALRSTVGIGTAVTVIFPPDRVVFDSAEPCDRATKPSSHVELDRRLFQGGA